jgi:hypothetical protein
MRQFIFTFSLILIAVFGLELKAQSQISDEILHSLDDDLNVGGNIFSDFQEDLEDSKVFEDERFYRYGRFYSVNFGGGLTTFTGNRGNAYTDNHPSFSLGVSYFLNFTSAISLGVQYSSHTMNIDTPVKQFPDEAPGALEVNLLRPYFAYRYYYDTANLSTPLTYANPYFTLRLEYWYQTNKFIDTVQSGDQKRSGGGLGFGGGFGFEFPIEFKEVYLGTELLVHMVDLFDKNTTDFNKVSSGEYGYEDLSGLAYSLIITVNQTW